MLQRDSHLPVRYCRLGSITAVFEVVTRVLFSVAYMYILLLKQ